MAASTRAIDTNIVVRYLAGEDPEQSPRARAFVNQAQVFLPVTVVLETERVLRSRYRLSPGVIVAALRSFMGLSTVTVGDSEAVHAALDLVEGGMDFADALHLMLSQDCEAFVTFDRTLVRGAAAAGIAGVREP